MLYFLDGFELWMKLFLLSKIKGTMPAQGMLFDSDKKIGLILLEPCHSVTPFFNCFVFNDGRPCRSLEELFR